MCAVKSHGIGGGEGEFNRYAGWQQIALFVGGCAKEFARELVETLAWAKAGGGSYHMQM